MQSTQQTTWPPEVRDHETTHRFRVKPADVGVAGFVDGGTLLDWIDKAAHGIATQWCGGNCVVASVGNLHLDRPIGVGEVVELQASLVYTGRSSMHVLVTIHSSHTILAKAIQTSQCPMVFVAVDDTGKPVEVPQWTPVTMLELQRQRQARVRVRMRKRIESAVAAQSYTAEGTAACITLRLHAADANSGGQVVRWIDEAAYKCGTDWSGAEVITSYIAGIRFYRPIAIGNAVEVTARIIHTGPRSIHIVVQVTNTDSQLAADGLLVVVSLDERGGARPVPPWQPATDEDRRLDQHARNLIELRQFNEPFTISAAEVLPC
jgi:4-hydroxybenzoyl-CoA thioesterase